MKTNTILAAFALAFSTMGAVGTASAGGLIGDVIEFSCGGCGVGKAADEAHRQFKHANPNYGKAEEKFTNDARERMGLPRHCDPIFNKWGEQVGCN